MNVSPINERNTYRRRESVKARREARREARRCAPLVLSFLSLPVLSESWHAPREGHPPARQRTGRQLMPSHLLWLEDPAPSTGQAPTGPAAAPPPRPCFCCERRKAYPSKSIHPCHLPSSSLPGPFYAQLDLGGRQDGEAPSRFDYVPKATGHRHRSPLREVRREMRHLRLVCAPLLPRAHLRRVQLRIQHGSLRDLRWAWHLRCVLLQRMCDHGEGQRRVSKDYQRRIFKSRLILRTKEIRIQKEVERPSKPHHSAVPLPSRPTRLLPLRHSPYRPPALILLSSLISCPLSCPHPLPSPVFLSL